MPMPQETTTTKPYPTIEDKVKLLQEHGISFHQYGGGTNDGGASYQSVIFRIPNKMAC